MAHKTIALATELRERWPSFPIKLFGVKFVWADTCASSGLVAESHKFPGDPRLTLGPYEILQGVALRS